jgi:ribosomal protein L6P/L9E
MSRIGKQPVKLAKGVDVRSPTGGARGGRAPRGGTRAALQDRGRGRRILVQRDSGGSARAMHSLMRALLANMPA